MNWLILLFLLIFIIVSAIMAFNYPNPGIRIVCGILLILFGLSLFGGIDYKTGEQKITTNSMNESCILENAGGTLCLNATTTGFSTETTTDQYTNYSNYVLNTIALILILLGVIITLSMEEEIKYDDEEDE